MSGRFVLRTSAQVDSAETPITSERVPFPFDQSVRKPGIDVPAMSSAPASIASLICPPPSITTQFTVVFSPALSNSASSSLASRMTISGK